MAGEASPATCCCCYDGLPECTQQECGHCTLCGNCASRIFAEVRAIHTLGQEFCGSRTPLLQPDDPSVHSSLLRFALAPQERRCPSCRTAMLLPLRKGPAGPAEPLSDEELDDALRAAEERSGGERHFNAQGVLQALRALFPRVPAEKRGSWFKTVGTVCESVVRLSAGPWARHFLEPRRPRFGPEANTSACSSLAGDQLPAGPFRAPRCKPLTCAALSHRARTPRTPPVPQEGPARDRREGSHREPGQGRRPGSRARVALRVRLPATVHFPAFVGSVPARPIARREDAAPRPTLGGAPPPGERRQQDPVGAALDAVLAGEGLPDESCRRLLQSVAVRQAPCPEAKGGTVSKPAALAWSARRKR